MAAPIACDLAAAGHLDHMSTSICPCAGAASHAIQRSPEKDGR